MPRIFVVVALCKISGAQNETRFSFELIANTPDEVVKKCEILDGTPKFIQHINSVEKVWGPYMRADLRLPSQGPSEF